MRERLDGLTWRRFANVALLCLVSSTQILFQPDLFQDWSPQAIARGWLDYFTEVLLCGTAMWILVTLLTPFAGERPLWRTALALAALVAGSLLGSLAAMAWLQPPGFYPTLPLFVGDALRWALFGALVHFAHEHLRRAARDAAAIDAASVAQESLGRQMIEARLEVLRAQIEPHFLFNTLAHVKRLYGLRPEVGVEMLSSLRRYLGAELPRMRESGSTLAHEVEFVRAYLNIVRIRLGTRLAYSIEVPESLQAQPLPSMMIITLVENAVKHGIAPCEEGGTISVRARASSGFLEVEVADTGAGFQASDGTGVGLANIRARLRGLYGERGTLALLHNQPQGVISRMRVPFDPVPATRGAA